MVVAVAGVVTLLIRGDVENLTTLNVNIGDGLMLLSVVSWMIYALLIKRLSKRYSGFTLTFYATLFGALLLILFAPSEDCFRQIRQISPASFLAVIYMGAGASGAGYLLYNLSIAGIGPTRTSGLVYSFLPMFVAILAFLIFGEPITLVMVFSAALILLGLRLMMRRPEPPPNE